MPCRLLVAVPLLALALGGPVLAGPIYRVDENGNSNVGLPFALTNDPGPGGLAGVLTYTLPFAGTQGDVGLFDSPFDFDPLDVVRFNGNGTLIFYSNNLGGFDSLADTPSPPSADYANAVPVLEIGGSAFYTPAPGDPGYDPSGPTYIFVSDLPEPSTLALAGLGGLCLLGYHRRRRSAVM